MASVDQLLGVLPPFTNEMVLIESVQEVPDIIREVVDSHKYFSGDYDHIWEFFHTGSIEQTCRKLFEFCKDNIAYVVESESRQTTKSPAAMLGLGHGDCKHYAGFIAGVLSAIARNTGEKINWAYRFASYDHFNDDPGHVFVVVIDKKNSWWVDPVLSSFDERLEPTFFIDKKISDMPLYRVSGIGQPEGGAFHREFYEAVEDAGMIGYTPTEGDIQQVQENQSSFNLSTYLDTITSIFGGGDAVPDYPVKLASTFNSLKASVIEHVGVVAPKGKFEPGYPSSVAMAESMLAKAIKRKNEEIALGHGYGDGVGWDTLQMLYDETITSLRAFIASGGQTSLPQTTLPGSYFPTGQTLGPSGNFLTNTSLFGMPNWVWLAGAAAYFFLRKKSAR